MSQNHQILTKISKLAVNDTSDVQDLLLSNFPDFASVIPDYVADTRDILVVKRVDILADKWGTLKRVVGALVFEKFTTPRRWIALDLVAVEVSERGAGVGSTLMNQFLDHFPAHEILLNSKSNVQKFYERFLFVNFKKPVHKRSKQEKIMNPSSASKLMIRTQTSKQKSLDLPKTLDHPNPLHQFLHKNSNTPEKYPAWDEFHRRIFYVKNKKYHCSFCPNDGGQSFIRRDKDSCKCEYKNWKLGDQYVIKAAE